MYSATDDLQLYARHSIFIVNVRSIRSHVNAMAQPCLLVTALLFSRDRVETTLIGRWDFPPSLTSPSRASPDPDEPKQISLMGVASESGAGARLT